MTPEQEALLREDERGWMRGEETFSYMRVMCSRLAQRLCEEREKNAKLVHHIAVEKPDFFDVTFREELRTQFMKDTLERAEKAEAELANRPLTTDAIQEIVTDLGKVKTELAEWKRLYNEQNTEWIRVLTGYLPTMQLPVYSPATIGDWIKHELAEARKAIRILCAGDEDIAAVYPAIDAAMKEKP